MQSITGVIFLLCLVAKEIESSDSDWSIQWYIGEPYQLDCDVGNRTNIKNVIWDTPTGKGLAWPLDDADFQIMNIDGSKLLVKSISPALHGVYICTVYDVITGSIERRNIYGLNIHEEKYRDMIDKYKHNLSVAGIATGSFLALVTAVGVINNFRYISDDDKRKYAQRKRAQRHMYAGSAPHAPAAYENGGYDVSTQL